MSRKYSSKMISRPASPIDTSPSSPTPTNSSKFRFKSKDPYPFLPSETRHQKRSSTSRHRHRHHHRSKRRRSPSPRPLSPNTAFRESLFDALADDEGAAFWEGVYGQPIHNYSPFAPRSNTDGAEGELEKMDDEEYVAYVRSKMWEKSHAYIAEERKRREESRKSKRRREEEGKEFEKGVEEALKRGEERRRKGKWRACWEEYIKAWERQECEPDKSLRERMIWPVESHKWEDVGNDEIERFYRNAPQPTVIGQQVDVGAVLKVERVKWHPDKIQQRFGSRGIDETTMKTVTAVFQVIDRMWSIPRGD